jgi:uncharacterized membrane protein
MSASDVWQTLLLVVLPLLGLYVGLMVWSTKRDRWPRR